MSNKKLAKTKKGNERSLQPLLPAAQSELDQKVQHCTRFAYHAEAYGLMELIAKGMKMQAIRAVAENSEVLEISGFKSLEDFFDFLGIKRRKGFYLKKIAEAFSDEEVQTLHSMRFSQRDILKLASLPAGQLPDLENIEDPEELKATIHGLLAENKTLREVGTQVGREAETLREDNRKLKAMLPNDLDLVWALDAVMRAERDIADFHSNMNLLLESQDHRLVRNPEFKAKIVALYEMFYRMAIEVSYKIEELTGYNPCGFSPKNMGGYLEEGRDE